MRNSSEICQEYSRSSYKGTWLNQYIMEKITKILKEEEENKSTIAYRWLQCRLMLLGRVLKVYADPCLTPSHPRDSNKRLKDNSIIACTPHKLPAPARTFLLRVSQKKIRKPVEEAVQVLQHLEMFCTVVIHAFLAKGFSSQ